MGRAAGRHAATGMVRDFSSFESRAEESGRPISARSRRRCPLPTPARPPAACARRAAPAHARTHDLRRAPARAAGGAQACERPRWAPLHAGGVAQQARGGTRLPGRRRRARAAAERTPRPCNRRERMRRPGPLSRTSRSAVPALRVVRAPRAAHAAGRALRTASGLVAHWAAVRR
jgi:hypothetical protein